MPQRVTLTLTPGKDYFLDGQLDGEDKDQTVWLVELVLRQNVHVHNRGIVVERYLEREGQSKPKDNLFDLKLGEVTVIGSTGHRPAPARPGL